MQNFSSGLFLCLVRFNQRMLKRMDAQLSFHGLNFTEYQVLHELNLASRATMPRIELARAVGLSASGVTRLIAPMQKLGLVEKESHPRDARMSLVKLSEAGKTIYDETSATVAHAADGLLGSLTGSQQKALERLFSSPDSN